MNIADESPTRIGLTIAPLVALAIVGWAASHLSDVKVVAVVVLATAYMEYCLALRGAEYRPSLLPRTLAQARSLWDGWRDR